jgi:hypothetical protein
LFFFAIFVFFAANLQGSGGLDVLRKTEDFIAQNGVV